MSLLKRASESLARRTSRRSLFGRGWDIAFGALTGAAAGSLTASRGAIATEVTSCGFPGPPCNCDQCNSTGVCAKPCLILTAYYASGCWVTFTGVTCCDCDCQNLGSPPRGWCGCGTDYHNSPSKCP